MNTITLPPLNMATENIPIGRAIDLFKVMRETPQEHRARLLITAWLFFVSDEVAAVEQWPKSLQPPPSHTWSAHALSQLLTGLGARGRQLLDELWEREAPANWHQMSSQCPELGNNAGPIVAAVARRSRALHMPSPITATGSKSDRLYSLTPEFRAAWCDHD